MTSSEFPEVWEPSPSERCRSVRETPQMRTLLASSPNFRTPGMVFAPLAVGSFMALVFVGLIARQTVLATSDQNRLRWGLAADRHLLLALSAAAGLSLLVAAYGFARWRRFLRAPAIAVPAVAISKRSTRLQELTFFVTFWSEGRGASEEVVDLGTFDAVEPGDIGAAWFREGRFVGFRKLEL